MDIGVNYPWVRHGWDFGPPIAPGIPDPAWSDPAPGAAASGTDLRLDQDLRFFKSLGITSVRWFLLGDGWNCGTPIWDGSNWNYSPPSVDALGMTTQFEQVLQVFQRNQC